MRSRHQKKLDMVFFVFLSIGLLSYACGGGGGGGGGGNPSSAPAAQSSSTASKAILNALGAAQTGGAGDHSKPSFKKSALSHESDAAKIRLALAGFKRSLKATQEKIIHEESEPCTSGSGKFTVDDNDTPDDSTDDFSLLEFHDCVTKEDGVTFTHNGSLLFELTSEGSRLTLTDFFERATDPSGTVSESNLNGTIDFSGNAFICQKENEEIEIFLENGTLTVNVTGFDKRDNEGDGTLELDESFSMTNFTMKVIEAHAAAPTCTPGATTLTLNGGMGFTDNINGDDSFSANFSNFQMVLTPVTKTASGISTKGVTMSLSGTVALTSACTNGTFTLSTPTDALPFVPEEEDCPVEGKILVTQGSATTAVTFTSGGGVQIDEGNNGSTEKEFADCFEAEACS